MFFLHLKPKRLVFQSAQSQTLIVPFMSLSLQIVQVYIMPDWFKLTPHIVHCCPSSAQGMLVLHAGWSTVSEEGHHT